jgi:hypothetical protein
MKFCTAAEAVFAGWTVDPAPLVLPPQAARSKAVAANHHR